jgi:hypothetical protein
MIEPRLAAFVAARRPPSGSTVMLMRRRRVWDVRLSE